jgi:hypothetical protein
MLDKKWFFISVFYSLWANLFAQTVTKIDTFYLIETQRVVELSEKFVIPSSMSITSGGDKIEPVSINRIESKITLPKDKVQNSVIIKYKYLKKGLPLQFGPRLKSLPILNDSSDQLLSNNLSEKKDLEKNKDFFSSGTIYRSLNISPLGSSNFTGGLQMQINGVINKNIKISGILSDQDLPFQPEGTTRELEELDKVSIIVQHENFRIGAGDILYKDPNNSINLKKKLTGLKNTFSTENFSGSSVYAGSRGTFYFLEIYGRDGDQGPYQLLNNIGNKEIVVLAGTEKVWANGKKLIRGESFDYTIDYSLGQVFFTPNLLIHNDVKLLFEYEYTDFNYEKSFTGGSIKTKNNKFGEIAFGIYKESELFQEDDLINDSNKSLLTDLDGKIKLSTVVENEFGDYLQQDTIYFYDPENKSQLSPRYSISFNYDPKGNYRRKISNNGRIYYEFIKDEEKLELNDYYSPWKDIFAPKNHQFGYLNGKYIFNKYIKVNAELRASKKNQNLLSNSLIKNGGSYLTKIEIDSIILFQNKIKLEFSEWNRGKNYFSLGRENNINQTRIWDLDSLITKDVIERSIKATLLNNDMGKTDVEFSSLKNSLLSFSTVKINTLFYTNRIKDSFINIIRTDKQVYNFHRLNSKFQINNKIISPYLTLLNEKKSFSNKFYQIGSGLNFRLKNSILETGIERKVDESFNQNRKFEKIAEDVIGSLKFYLKSKEGWKHDLVLKKRFKKRVNQPNLNYSLADYNMSFFNVNKVFNFKILGRKEESIKEEVAIIYDSIGVNLGQYRYDSIFNTYIPDPNGAFISYSIFTGKKQQNSNYQGMQDFTFDFSKIRNNPKVMFRINSRQSFSGSYEKINQIFDFDFYKKDILHSNFRVRAEATYTGKNSFLSWMEVLTNLNGSDPRGNQLNKKREYGIIYNKKLNQNISLKNDFKSTFNSIQTNIPKQINRILNGWWESFEIQIHKKNGLDFDLGFFSGYNNGTQAENNFTVYANGLSLTNKYLFKKTGMINSQLKIVNVYEKNRLPFIPPESVNGFALGKSFLFQSRIQYFITKSISSIITINTINDSRYSNFFTLKGELRAYF